MSRLFSTPLSDSSCRRLHWQGYSMYSDKKLNDYKYGIRFAYLGCGSLVVGGLIFQSVLLWGMAMAVAFLAVVLPRHPFDYLYNFGVRYLIDKPSIPTRTVENRFACGIATVWLGLVILLFNSGAVIEASVLSGVMILQAFVVGTIDFCVPSLIYRALFLRGSKLNNGHAEIQ